MRQVIDLQGFAYDAAKGLAADFAATADKEERARIAASIAGLSKGWVSLQDSKREILGKPRAGVKKFIEPPRRKPRLEIREAPDDGAGLDTLPEQL